MAVSFRADYFPAGNETQPMTGGREPLQEEFQEIAERVGERLRALEGATLLVAGGGGFLPSFILDALAFANESLFSRPCHLICVDNFSTSPPERIGHLEGKPWFRLMTHDVTVPLKIEPSTNVGYVVHGASIPSPPAYRRRPLETMDVNFQGTRNLLEFARQQEVKSFLYLSSSEIYGDPSEENIPTPENYHGNVSCTGPRACYDESKRLAETMCMVYFRSFGLQVKIVRPFNVYGPRLWLDDGRVISDFIRDGLNGNPITLMSDGRATRSFCYITDAVSAILLLLLTEHDGEAFNVGNSEEVTIASVAEEINKMFGGKPGLRFARSEDADYLSDNPRRRCPDLSKIRRSIPWEPRVCLAEGLRRTVRWYLENQART